MELKQSSAEWSQRWSMRTNEDWGNKSLRWCSLWHYHSICKFGLCIHQRPSRHKMKMSNEVETSTSKHDSCIANVPTTTNLNLFNKNLLHATPLHLQGNARRLLKVHRSIKRFLPSMKFYCSQTTFQTFRTTQKNMKSLSGWNWITKNGRNLLAANPVGWWIISKEKQNCGVVAGGMLFLGRAI